MRMQLASRIREKCSEFKTELKKLNIGDEVALFKTHSNVPLKRENKNVYMLSSGVGLATLRPLLLDYLERGDYVNHIHSLNIDSSREYLFTYIFESTSKKKFINQFVDNRDDYYGEVEKLAADKSGVFYVIGSDDFIKQHIKLLGELGINPEQIMLD